MIIHYVQFFNCTMMRLSHIAFLCLIVTFLTGCDRSTKDKYPNLKAFPAFSSTNKNLRLRQLDPGSGNVYRVYVSRNQKQLLVLSAEKNGYLLSVYDQDLKLLKKQEAPGLDGLFGLDDLGNLYAGQGYFEHQSFAYRPIRKLEVTDKASAGKAQMTLDFSRFDDFVTREDTLISFTRKDYLGNFYYLKKAGNVYQVFFKNCAYCESRFNRENSVSEFRAEDSWDITALKPDEQLHGGWLNPESIHYFKVISETDTIRFKLDYTDKKRVPAIRKTVFAGKTLLSFRPEAGIAYQLYYFAP